MRSSFRSKVSVLVHAEIIISCSLGFYHPQQSKFHYTNLSRRSMTNWSLHLYYHIHSNNLPNTTNLCNHYSIHYVVDYLLRVLLRTVFINRADMTVNGQCTMLHTQSRFYVPIMIVKYVYKYVNRKDSTAMLAISRSTGVTLEVNLRNPLYAGKEACGWGMHPGFQTQGRCHQKSKTRVLPHKKD